MKIITKTSYELYQAYIYELALTQSKYQFKQPTKFLLEDHEYADNYDKAIAAYLRYQVESGEYEYDFLTEEDHGGLYLLLAKHVEDNINNESFRIYSRIMTNLRKHMGKIIERDIKIKLEEIESEPYFNKEDDFHYSTIQEI